MASDHEAAAQAAKQVQGGKYGFVWTQFNDLPNFYYDRSVFRVCYHRECGELQIPFRSLEGGRVGRGGQST